jgi:hypothetical protein
MSAIITGAMLLLSVAVTAYVWAILITMGE